MNFAFDEWNVWYTQDAPVERGWEQAPRLLEDRYTVVDAVVVGSMLLSLLRHADRVRIACLAQLVNAIGAIRTEPAGPAWRQTIFHPFALTSRYGRGLVLRPAITAPTYETAEFGEVPVLDAVAVRDDPARVRPRTGDSTAVDGGELSAPSLAPTHWSAPVPAVRRPPCCRRRPHPVPRSTASPATGGYAERG